MKKTKRRRGWTPGSLVTQGHARPPRESQNPRGSHVYTPCRTNLPEVQPRRRFFFKAGR